MPNRRHAEADRWTVMVAHLLGLRNGPNLDELYLNSDDGNKGLIAIAQGVWESRWAIRFLLSQQFDN
jgi:hypothetical protein